MGVRYALVRGRTRRDHYMGVFSALIARGFRYVAALGSVVGHGLRR
jgi:hypothetical protein